MRKYFLLFGVILLSACSATIKKDVDRNYSGHPIIGTWIHSSNGCDESYEFTTDGTRIVHSNLEVVRAKYEISSLAPERGVYLLKDTVLEDNGKHDCSGSTSDMTGDTVEVILFIQHTPDRFSFCFDEQLADCIGPFVKQQ